MELPVKNTRKGKYLAFDDVTGNPIAVGAYSALGFVEKTGDTMTGLLTVNSNNNESLTSQAISALINTEVSNYFALTLGKFGKSFRRSNLLTLVDEVSPAVLSSRAVIRMQQRITAVINVNNTFVLTFPSDIAQPVISNTPTAETYVVRSGLFTVDGVTCRIVNETYATKGVGFSSNKLQVINAGNGVVVVDNIGSYDATKRTVEIVSFRPSGLLGGGGDIKISVLPANQSAISPLRNDILHYDTSESVTTPVSVSADN
jgi:hypothetical protein